MRTISICKGDLVFQFDANGGGSLIHSNLKQKCPYCRKTDCYSNCSESQHDRVGNQEDIASRRDYNAAMDGIESLMLALLCSSIKTSINELDEILTTAVDACANNL